MRRALVKTQGEVFQYVLTGIVDLEGAAVADLTGWVFAFTVKVAFADADPGALQVKSPSGWTFSGGTATGTISTATLKAGIPYVFDVRATDPQGRPTVIERGLLILNEPSTLTL